MPFFGKYQKTYSKKNPRLKYDESLFRIATEDSCYENGINISVASPSSNWKDDFDKLIPKK